jgi:TPR repeat protein
MKRRTAALHIGGLFALALIGPASPGPLEDGEAAYRAGDFAVAMELFRPLAEDGEAKAQFHLGRMYALGQGVAPDSKEAIGWYRKAAEQGNADAEYVLAVMVEDNAAASPRDAAEARAWLRQAAEQGGFNAQFRLGMAYAKGDLGLPRNDVLARMRLSLAALRAENAYVRDLVAKERDKVSMRMTPAEIAEAQRRTIEWKAK